MQLLLCRVKVQNEETCLSPGEMVSELRDDATEAGCWGGRGCCCCETEVSTETVAPLVPGGWPQIGRDWFLFRLL